MGFKPQINPFLLWKSKNAPRTKVKAPISKAHETVFLAMPQWKYIILYSFGQFLQLSIMLSKACLKSINNFNITIIIIIINTSKSLTTSQLSESASWFSCSTTSYCRSRNCRWPPSGFHFRRQTCFPSETTWHRSRHGWAQAPRASASTFHPPGPIHTHCGPTTRKKISINNAGVQP